MKVNPYIAAALVALLTSLPVLSAGLTGEESSLSVAEWLSAASVFVGGLVAALGIQTPSQGNSAPSKGTEPEVVIVPMDKEDA